MMIMIWRSSLAPGRLCLRHHFRCLLAKTCMTDLSPGVFQRCFVSLRCIALPLPAFDSYPAECDGIQAMNTDLLSSDGPGRTGRRKRVRKERPAGRVSQSPWGQPQYVDAPTEPLDALGVERIHNAAMKILEEIGIDFLHDGAREILKQAGCKVRDDSPTVRMDRGLVMQEVAKAPHRIVMTPRNKERELVFGESYAAFCQVSSPPNVSDLDHGRRVGNRADYQNLLKLTQDCCTCWRLSR